ncbi:MAG TPA: aminotransferase class V-fold PLP-dependent enzyme [Thermoanaerobaculaceae bacterium]|nr:aminotransferase class V-fold PLP-dependent enzyme [Thermoanaerobaculaceae bacterium]HRS16064.1 aminotransferase class V-fold PLP-dependent enzyme [Thermoanaerobaculaceae bacterium]
MEAIYLNHAATSFPKPREVVEAVTAWFDRPPVDAARGGDSACDPIEPCRRELALLLGAADPVRVVLLPSSTYAINLVIGALVTRGSHVVTSVLEHNSVLRPIAHRERDLDVAVSYLGTSPDGIVRVDELAASLRPETALVALTWASNVSGAIQPVEDFARIAAAAGVPLLLDASQAAGAVEIHHRHLPGRVFIAFSGHKGLWGPPGVGGLVVPDGELPQTVVGGTGVRSESPLHPPELPLRHEAGTPNLPGLAGLLAGVRLIREVGVHSVGAHRATLVRRLRQGLAALSAVRALPLAGDDERIGIVSFSLRGWSPDAVAFVLRESFGIEVRSGLHCAPLAHRALGGGPEGCVRASVGWSTTEDDVDSLVGALGRLEAR